MALFKSRARRDKSQRTSRIRTASWVSGLCTITIVASTVFAIGGAVRFGQVVKGSSTPTKSELTFNRSAAKVTIASYYTDKSESVLIARLSVPTSSNANLPFKGKDYRVFISSPALDGLQEVPALFGRFSTDGDMFLVLPKPTHDVYTVFIMNSNYIGSVDGGGDTSSFKLDDAKQSVSRALSDYQNTTDDARTEPLVIKSDAADLIGFRMTLRPIFSDDAYKPKVLDGTLLDDNGKFDFKSFFNQVFKDSATAKLSVTRDQLHTKRAQLKKRLDEMTDRLKTNPNDTAASTSLSQTKQQLNTLDSQLKEIAESATTLDSISYKPQMFSNLLDKANVVNTKDMRV